MAMAEFPVEIKVSDDTLLVLNEQAALVELDVRLVCDAKSSFNGDDFEEGEFRCWAIHKDLIIGLLDVMCNLIHVVDVAGEISFTSSTSMLIGSSAGDGGASVSGWGSAQR